MKKKSSVLKCFSVLAGTALLLAGCATPEVTRTNEIPLDEEPMQGGISSADVRTVAVKMCPSILSLPEITGSSDPVRIKIADFKNKSRFFIDRNLFMNRLKLELNRHGRGRIRFLSNNEKVQHSRTQVLKDRQSAQIQKNLKLIAGEIAKSPILQQGKIVKVAVIPVLNTNMVNMNADSFTAMLRSEIFNAAGGKIQFLMPGVIKGADYFLTGQFIPESMKTEGIINLANYIEVVDARVKAGKSMYITSDGSSVTPGQVTTVQQGTNTSVTQITPSSSQIQIYERHLMNILNDPAMRKNPNVNKRLNIMLVDAASKASVYEKMIQLDRKITDNSGAARYIISGEISGMSQRRNGVGTDYLMISIQLTDPESNEVIWEDAYEVKRLTRSGIVYQ